MLQKPQTKQSKAGFIRAQSWDLSAREVVKRAKKLGITIAVQTVHTTRSMARKKDNTNVLPAAGPRPGKTYDASVSGSNEQEVKQFVQLVATLGLRRSEALLAAVRVKVTSI